jgi:hypothetical protein
MTMIQIDNIQRRRTPLEMKCFLSLKAQFMELHTEYRKLSAELNCFKEEYADFVKLEKLQADLQPLMDNWKSWQKVAAICEEMTFVQAESTNTMGGG